ncbi:MAG: aminoglycoside phosphotransferase family protein [Gammaproteobacteria bacterium]
MQLNPNFISNIQDVYGETGQSWLTELPSHLTRLCEKYDLRFLSLMPDLTYHFVGLVEIIATAETAIIKMAPTNQNIDTEVKWLQCFNQGVPKIYWFDEEQHACLMERIVSGKSLKSMVQFDDDAATRIICQTILNLQSHQQKRDGFKHLSELAKDLLVLKGRIDDKMLSQALTWFQEMTSDRTDDVLLHGDLHHDNILASDLTWKVIDPHAYIGDPAFEVGPMIYNPRGDFFPTDRTIPETIQRRLKILAEALPFDAQRIKAWAFCMTVLSAAWTAENQSDVPELELMIARVINETSV